VFALELIMTLRRRALPWKTDGTWVVFFGVVGVIDYSS